MRTVDTPAASVVVYDGAVLAVSVATFTAGAVVLSVMVVVVSLRLVLDTCSFGQ